jgi:single-strand DNA-binding protein
MRDINRTMLLGRLGMDPVLRVSKNGIPFTSFNLATEMYIKSKNESETTWHRVVVWGKQAQWCAEDLKKGMPVFVEGRMKVRKYENDEGVVNYMHEVHVDKVNFLHRKASLQRADDIETVEAEMPVEELNH